MEILENSYATGDSKTIDRDWYLDLSEDRIHIRLEEIGTPGCRGRDDVFMDYVNGR